MKNIDQPICQRCFAYGHEPRECPFTRDELSLIGPIAAFIGARLHYPCPEINGQGNPWTSTILVEQHKEKFFRVRVYCKLAWDGLVKQKWAWLRDRQAREDAGEKFYDRLRDDELRAKLKTDVEPPPEFYARCARHDAIHYRQVHMDMVRLLPEKLAKRAIAEADHTELLHDNVDGAIKQLRDWAESNPGWKEYFTKKYRVSTNEEVEALFQVVYNPTWKDLMGLRD